MTKEGLLLVYRKYVRNTQYALVLVGVLGISFWTLPDYQIAFFSLLYLLATTITVYCYHIAKSNYQMYQANLFLTRKNEYFENCLYELDPCWEERFAKDLQQAAQAKVDNPS